MELNKWYEKGIHPEQYIEALDDHKKAFLHIYDHFNVPSDEAFFQFVKDKNLRVIVLAEVWCGHCMLNMPILFRLTEKADIPVRILARDENLELMDRYLTNGKSRSVPIFIFIDENGNEVTKWGPITKPVKQFTDHYKTKLPAKDADDYQDKFKELITITGKEFRENEEFWNASYEDIKQTVLAT